MKRSNAFLFLACCVVLQGTIPAAKAADASRGYAFTDKVVLAYYYIWFNEDNWLKPLAEGGNRERIGNLHPIVGAYNSWDSDIIEKHMRQMNRALIDALAVSWWYDEKPQGPNAILDTIYDKAQAHNLKITVDYEHGRFPMEQVYRDLRYFLDRYSAHPAMLKVEGAPVVMIWTAWGHTPEEWRDLFERLEKEGFDAFPIMSGSYQNGKGAAYLGPFRSLEEYTLVDIEDCQLADFMKTMRGHIDKYNKTKGFKSGKPAQHHATISPGYDERTNLSRKSAKGGFKGAGWKDRTKFGVHYPDEPEGAYYRGAFEAALSSKPDWLHISTFNELAEFSHIEATFEHGYTYIDLTAEFVRRFKGLK
ncbi:MAG TPA: hypothetical protein PKO36_16405 [Candidatus Hydrogenedentes bacterium]|nr:hypothetical protein [Candidatus Hydrogenedentota bacterium]HOV73318.1 hypothetical protein [Candidatus Hydrogenedentota bacterium]HPC15449.1 hypothetical protein [Candidatus Hydrogenedentota bacterium]HRT21112.1 hypothetical protein [Candidatus Hydrogenedentota bacterium]HRT64337.1 hypothetical protein [Candidatus Hydrogenedentota bacterium]